MKPASVPHSKGQKERGSVQNRGMKYKNGKGVDRIDPKWKAKERLGIILRASNQTIDFVLYSYIL